MEQETGGDKRKPGPVISRAIQTLLDRHGVPERKRNGALEAALGMGYQQVRRRMNGDTPWNVDEIKRLASHFGEPVFQLLGAMVDDAGLPAMLCVEGLRVSCTLWPGEAVPDDGTLGALIAVKGATSAAAWEVIPRDQRGDRRAFEVRRIVLEPAQPMRVAVVDEEQETAEAIVQVLRQKGLDAISYTKLDQMRSALETTAFDGYIVAWGFEGGDSSDILALVRSKSPAAPLVILSDPLSDSEEQRLEAVTTAFRAQLFEKPARTLSLYNALTLGFAKVTHRALDVQN